MWITISHDIALAVASTEKEQQLKHIVAALGTITQFETLYRKDRENQYNFLTEMIAKLDSKNPMDEGSIYSKTDCPTSLSLRAYLCYSLLNWLVDNVDKETVGNNLQTCINLIETLIEDALNQRTVKQWSITNNINKLESQVASTLCKLNSDSISI